MQSSSAGSDQEQKPVITVDHLSSAKDADDSDSDVRKVPEMVGFRSLSAAGPSGAARSSASGPRNPGSGRKRNAAPAEKEHKRMKRLLRNRVSAQQARERKKAYLSDLETRTKELEHRNAELEEKLSTLQQENAMLRKVIRNTAIRTNNSSGDK